jgi:hypothetical protein
VGAGGAASGEAMPAATMTAADGTLGYDADTEGLMRDEISPIQTVNGKTFLLQDGVWTDTTFEPDTMETVKIAFLSDAYFDLLSEQPELGAYLALGERVIVVVEGTAYEITTEE